MKCPICKNKNIDFDSVDGFTKHHMRECTVCGTLWMWKDDERIIIKQGEIKNESNK